MAAAWRLLCVNPGRIDRPRTADEPYYHCIEPYGWAPVSAAMSVRRYGNHNIRSAATPSEVTIAI